MKSGKVDMRTKKGRSIKTGDYLAGLLIEAQKSFYDSVGIIPVKLDSKD